jgi:hypothetical protein
MKNLQLTDAPVAKAEMLIRKPVAEVFEAFINPEITSKFWFTKGSGRLEVGKPIQWDWEMYNVSAQVTVKAIEENKRILIEWAESFFLSRTCCLRASAQGGRFPRSNPPGCSSPISFRLDGSILPTAREPGHQCDGTTRTSRSAAPTARR